ncbi:hypothetical protein U1Q18_029372 [Sarracenia purpurea var. burkii]
MAVARRQSKDNDMEARRCYSGGSTMDWLKCVNGVMMEQQQHDGGAKEARQWIDGVAVVDRFRGEANCREK